MNSLIDTRDDAVEPQVVNARRHMVRALAAMATVGAVGLLASCGSEESPVADFPTPTPSGSPTATPTATPTLTAVTDTDLIVMMQQLHYLQAEFYSRAIFGARLAASLVTGTGTQGAVVGGATVPIADAVLADALREIAAEKIDQVVRLRAVLGSANPARPDVNIATDETGVFTAYGRAAGEVVAPALYDVYANQEQFLLGAFLLEDAVLSGWRGVAPLMTSNASIETAAALLATTGFHTGVIRSQLFVRGAAPAGTAGTTVSPLRRSTLRLSDLRDGYSPPTDDDRGVASTGTAGAAADVSPGDGEGEIYGRLPQLTVNTFYMTRSAGTGGGFFPSGLNGTLRNSVAV